MTALRLLPFVIAAALATGAVYLAFVLLASMGTYIETVIP